jgi:Tol biopolymer transport system component
MDGKFVAFSARVPDKSMAWNTNLDIYTVPIDGSRLPVAISSDNKGSDSFPVYSPDGQYIAWLQMQTPQYEADKNQIVLFHRESKSKRILTEEWDRSPTSLTWASDSKSLYATAEDEGHLKIFEIELEDNAVTELVRRNSNSHLMVIPTDGKDRLLFLRSSFTAPPDLFTYDFHHPNETQSLIQQTFVNQDKMDQFHMVEPEVIASNSSSLVFLVQRVQR